MPKADVLRLSWLDVAIGNLPRHIDYLRFDFTLSELVALIFLRSFKLDLGLDLIQIGCHYTNQSSLAINLSPNFLELLICLVLTLVSREISSSFKVTGGLPRGLLKNGVLNF